MAKPCLLLLSRTHHGRHTVMGNGEGVECTWSVCGGARGGWTGGLVKGDRWGGGGGGGGGGEMGAGGIRFGAQ